MAAPCNASLRRPTHQSLQLARRTDALGQPRDPSSTASNTGGHTAPATAPANERAADYHLPGCARRVDDPDHMGPCTTTCTKTRFEGRPCRFHNHHSRLCEPVTDANHSHVPPEYMIGKRLRR